MDEITRFRYLLFTIHDLRFTSPMAVLKKIRSRLFSSGAAGDEGGVLAGEALTGRASVGAGTRYDIRPLTVAQLDECWRLDQPCFVDGEASRRATVQYLL